MGRILLVEDNAQARELFRDLLEAEGHEVDARPDASSVIAELDGGAAPGSAPAADLVLLDLMLPGTTGLELLRRLRADRPALPAVVVTALHEEEIERAAREAGAAAVVTKPVERAKLVGAIERALGRSR